MSSNPFPQAVIASLLGQSDQLAVEAARRMVRTIPRYTNIPVAKLAAQNQRTIEQIAKMMDESNFPVAREYFEGLTETRARAGIPIAEFLQAVEVMMAVVEEHVEQTFAADPAYRDRALRVLRAGTAFTRNIIGRRHLQNIVEHGRPDSPTKPDNNL